MKVTVTQTVRTNNKYNNIQIISFESIKELGLLDKTNITKTQRVSNSSKERKEPLNISSLVGKQEEKKCTMDREAWCAAIRQVARTRLNWTELNLGSNIPSVLSLFLRNKSLGPDHTRTDIAPKDPYLLVIIFWCDPLTSVCTGPGDSSTPIGR